MTRDDWDAFSRGSSIRRAGYEGFRRNVAVALGNWLASAPGGEPPGDRGACGHGPPRRIVGMFAREGMALSLIGLAVGGLLVVPVTRVVSDILEGFFRQSLHPLFPGGVVVFLLAVTSLASVIPARRASAVDPARVLKVE